MSEYDDRWRCRWCLTYTHPVATLVRIHEDRCVAKPSEDVA